MGDDLTADERAYIENEGVADIRLQRFIDKLLRLYDRQRVVLDVLRKSLADAPSYLPKQHRDPTPQEIGEAFAVLAHLKRVVAMLDGKTETASAWNPCCGKCGARFPNGPGQYTNQCPACGADWDGSEARG